MYASLDQIQWVPDDDAHGTTDVASPEVGRHDVYLSCVCNGSGMEGLEVCDYIRVCSEYAIIDGVRSERGSLGSPSLVSSQSIQGCHGRAAS